MNHKFLIIPPNLFVVVYLVSPSQEIDLTKALAKIEEMESNYAALLSKVGRAYIWGSCFRVRLCSNS